MPRHSIHLKEESFNFRIPADLKVEFKRATEASDKPAAQVIRDFMYAYVAEYKRSEPGYDAWFKKKVRESLEDPGDNVSHDEVMKEAKTRLSKRISKAGGNAD